MITDLFDAHLVAGLASRPEIIAADEEASLIGKIDAEGLSPFRFQLWTGKRPDRSAGAMISRPAGSRRPA